MSCSVAAAAAAGWLRAAAVCEERPVCPADLSQFPFDVRPRGPRDVGKQRYIVAHLGECHDKSCAAPWHVAVADDAFNVSQRYWSKKWRCLKPWKHKYGNNPPQQLKRRMRVRLGC